MSDDRSGIEMLEEVLKRLDNIEKRQSVLDINMKKILNSVNLADLINNATGTKLDGFARATPGYKPKNTQAKTNVAPAKTGFKNFDFNTNDASKLNTNNAPKRHLPVAKPKNIMVQGKMVTNVDGKISPLSAISVKIFNSEDILVKETRTNRAGHWISHLPPGAYVALFDGELNGKKLVPQNRNFVVPDVLPTGQSHVEVA